MSAVAKQLTVDDGMTDRQLKVIFAAALQYHNDDEQGRRSAAGRINKKQSKSRLDLIEMSSQRDEIDI